MLVVRKESVDVGRATRISVQWPLPDASRKRKYRRPLKLADSAVPGSYSSSSVKWYKSSGIVAINSRLLNAALPLAGYRITYTSFASCVSVSPTVKWG